MQTNYVTIDYTRLSSEQKELFDKFLVSAKEDQRKPTEEFLAVVNGGLNAMKAFRYGR